MVAFCEKRRGIYRPAGLQAEGGAGKVGEENLGLEEKQMLQGGASCGATECKEPSIRRLGSKKHKKTRGSLAGGD